jgi:hypothetical protein
MGQLVCQESQTGGRLWIELAGSKIDIASHGKGLRSQRLGGSARRAPSVNAHIGKGRPERSFHHPPNHRRHWLPDAARDLA